MKFDNKYLNKENIKIIVFLASSGFVFLFSFFMTVVLTNSLSEEVYGEFKYITNFLIVVPTFASFGIYYSTASIIAKRKTNDTQDLIGASLITVFIVSLFIVFLIYIIIVFAKIVNIELFTNLVLYLPFLSIFFIHQLLNQVYTGLGQTMRLSLYNVIPSFVKLTLVIIFIYILEIASLKIIIFIFIFSYLVVIVPKLITTKFGIKNLKKNIRLIFKDVKKSGMFIYFSSLLTGASTQVIGLIAANIYGFANYGFYSLAVSLSVVFQLIGSALAISRFRAHANLEKIPRKDFVLMAFMGIGAFSVMMLFIDNVFFWFYPTNYATTLDYFKILALANLFFGFMNIFNRFLIGKSQGKLILINSVITGIVNIISAVILMNFFSITGLVYSTLFVSVINLSIYVYAYWRFLRRSINEI